MSSTGAHVRAWTYFAGKDIFNAGATVGLNSARLGVGTANLAKKSTAFLWKRFLDHPGAAMAAGVPMYAGWSYSQSFTPHGGQDVYNSPTLSGDRVNVDYSQQAQMAASMQFSTVAPMGRVGTAPQMADTVRQGFENSTVNLVQGLHAGRH